MRVIKWRYTDKFEPNNPLWMERVRFEGIEKGMYRDEHNDWETVNTDVNIIEKIVMSIQEYANAHNYHLNFTIYNSLEEFYEDQFVEML